MTTLKKKEKAFFDGIINKFSDFFKDFDPNDITLGSIDYKAIEKDATKNSKEKYEISPERVETHWCSAPTRIPAKYSTRTNPTLYFRNFKALAIQRAREQRDRFLPQVKEKVANMRRQIFDELDKKNKDELAHLEYLKTQLNQKEKFKAENEAKMAVSRDASKELIKLAEDYGIKF